MLSLSGVWGQKGAVSFAVSWLTCQDGLHPAFRLNVVVVLSLFGVWGQKGAVSFAVRWFTCQDGLHPFGTRSLFDSIGRFSLVIAQNLRLFARLH